MIKKIFFLICISFIWIPSSFSQEKIIVPEFTLGWYYPSVSGVISQTDFKIAIDFWFQDFSKKFQFGQADIRIFQDIDKMKTAFNNGKLTLIVAPPLQIIKHFDLSMLADGFMGTSITGKTHGIVILVQKDKQINQLSDLKNKRLVMSENDELASMFLDSLIIPTFHQNYHQVFKSVELKKKQNPIILSLFFNKADIGITDLETYNLMSELNPQIAKKIKILKHFPINASKYGFFHKKFPAKLRKLFLKELMLLNTSIRSQEILNTFRLSSLTPCTVKSLDPFIRLNDYYNQMIQQKVELR